MKTKSILTLSMLFFLQIIFAQPQKGTWSLGGSGYWNKISGDDELKYKIYEINSEINYFIFNHLVAGSNLTLQGEKNFTKVNDPNFHCLYFAPIVEAYILNRERYGISVKGTMNFIISTNWDKNDKVPSYMFGPKASWNITPNLSTYLWFAYRKLDEFDNTVGYRSVVPSDNFDIRWGFSYFLHRKEKN